MYDVIIIGGGVVGCAIARELSRYKTKTLLLEKTNDICNGQSKANTAIIHGGYDCKPNTLKAKYNVLGNAMFDKIHEELEVPVQWNTSLVVSFNKDDHPALEKLLNQGIQNGCRGELRIIDEEELRRREPNVGSTACEALLVGSGGIVCPYELTVAFAENAAMNGAEFLRNAKVTKLRKLANGNWQVVSTVGTFETRAVVNAAGAYSDEFNNMVSERKVHIRPRRGEYYIVDKKYRDVFHAAMFQLPTKMGKGILVAPTVDGTVLIGPTAEDIDDKEDKRTTAFGLAKTLREAARTWEKIPTRAFITTFSGLRATGDAGDFVLGRGVSWPHLLSGHRQVDVRADRRQAGAEGESRLQSHPQGHPQVPGDDRGGAGGSHRGQPRLRQGGLPLRDRHRGGDPGSHPPPRGRAGHRRHQAPHPRRHGPVPGGLLHAAHRGDPGRGAGHLPLGGDQVRRRLQTPARISL